MLRAVLFSFYINGICDGRSRGHVISFNDDTVFLRYAEDSWVKVRDSVNYYFRAIKRWFTNK